MESEIIDRLYKIYKGCNNPMAKSILRSECFSYAGGVDAFVTHLNEYINSNIGQLPNYFLSKESESSENELLRNIVDTMQNVAEMVDFYKTDLRMKYFADEYGYKEDGIYEFEDDPYYRDSFVDSKVGDSVIHFGFDDDESAQMTIPQDLFSMSIPFIREAYATNCESVPGVSVEGFEHVLSFIEYVKSHGLISRVFMNNDISQMDFENVIASILDADKSIVENLYVEPLEFTSRDVVGSDTELFDYFSFIKSKCEGIEDLDFKQYRSAFISRRGINVDLDKLVFARNYLEFIRTGIMPSPDGSYYFEADEFEKDCAKEEFLKLYRRGFDNREFAKHQANFIFDINGAMLSPGKMEKFKAVQNGNSLSIGCLMTSYSLFCDSIHDDVCFLIHINIDDVTNSKSNYELQLNILPQGSIEDRVQLVRFDNWKEEQTHKNLGNKLNTVTHIHLYNHLDLLRGKKNGAFDIAFNLTENSTDFETALKVFAGFVLQNSDLQKDFIKKVLKSKDTATLSAPGSSME